MSKPKRMSADDFQRDHVPEYARKVPKKPWSAATPTTCARGHKHPSKLEATVCARLTALCDLTLGLTLFQQVRFNLFTISPRDNGRPMTFTVDFAIVEAGEVVRLVDAKGRKSRDWDRGARACEAATGIKVEEVSK